MTLRAGARAALATLAPLALLVLVAALRAPVEDPPLAPEAVKPLERVAQELAKAGRGSELDEALDLLRRCGMEPAAHEKRAKQCRADLAKAKKAAPTVPTAARSLAKLAADLAKSLPDRDDPARVELARLILRLDGRNETAHRSLGREPAGGDWLDERARARRARAAGIEQLVVQARSLPVAVSIGPSDSRWFAASACSTPVVAASGSLRVHSVWPAAKIERVLREALRAAALLNALLTGELAIPRMPAVDYVFFAHKPEYDNAVILLHEAGKIDDAELARCDELSGVNFDDNRSYLGYELVESNLSVLLLSHPIFRMGFRGAGEWSLGDTQVGMVAGLANWAALTLLGTRLPAYAWDEEHERTIEFKRTSGLTESQRIEYERLLRLSEAGIAGGRAWIEYLAARREDPPLTAALLGHMGEIQGETLLKATFVVEMLAQDGPLLPLLRRLPDASAGKTPAELFAAACGQAEAAFEAGWREWLLPAPEGLAERLGAEPPKEALSAGESLALANLNELRRRAGTGDADVEIDRGASESCRKHALYLARNPEQLASWPDAHEEYPDRPGFDVAGAWAGTHSVIAPGTRDAAGALEGWMGTFYHRLPLLDPGLVRIGFAHEEGTAVLDSGTFVRPLGSYALPEVRPGYAAYWAVVWPPPDARDVPTRFQPELPEPVPGHDCGAMGYPITFQMRWVFHGSPDLALELCEGARGGKQVACWFSTPSAPTNPDLAPDGAWCLIPKEPLAPGRDYTVSARLEIHAERVVSDEFSWSFRCGR